MEKNLFHQILDELDDEAQQMAAVMCAASSAAASYMNLDQGPHVYPPVLRGDHDMNRQFMDQLHSMDDDIFYEHLRMSKSTFSALVDKLDPVMTRVADGPQHSGGKPKTSTKIALTLTLWYLVSKTTFREVGNLFGYHRAAVNRKFHETTVAICEALSDQLKWPDTQHEIEAGFAKIAGFPGVVGAIDGTHFKVIAPAQDQVAYNSRKQVHTVGALAVVDEQLRFLHAFIGYPGSLADQRALDNCSLGVALKTSPNEYVPSNNYHILGDSAFGLQVNLLTPYKDHGSLTHRQINYNKKHSQTRQVVENAFGLLKVKFRSLLSLEVELHKAPGIIKACFLLHNFMLNHVLQDRVVMANDDVIIGNLNAVQKRTYLENYLLRN